MLNHSSRKIKRKTGLPPGSLVFTGAKRTEEVSISYISYNTEDYNVNDIKSINDILPLPDDNKVHWINVTGLHQLEVFETIKEKMNIHPLVLEDILHTIQRPKIDVFDNYVFIVLRILFFNEKEKEIKSEQVSLILGKNYVLSFFESDNSYFKLINERLGSNKGRIRKQGSDYLAYSIIDAIIDNYFDVLDSIGDELETLEDQIIIRPAPKTMRIIHRFRRKLFSSRKAVLPLREVMRTITQEDIDYIKDSTKQYFRDLYGHTMQIIESIETQRELLADMLDIYLSSVSYKLNEIMKVLTIIATIFIPLTFISSVYGMNFKNMPELDWAWGYPAVLILMLVIALAMLYYFKRKKWF